jgi:hypothetical protein
LISACDEECLSNRDAAQQSVSAYAAPAWARLQCGTRPIIVMIAIEWNLSRDRLDALHH